jgi:hypothetical protein
MECPHNVPSEKGMLQLTAPAQLIGASFSGTKLCCSGLQSPAVFVQQINTPRRTGALVGSADEIADALIDFKRAGASPFILSGWPRMQSMKLFGEDVLPRVRRLEKPHGSGMTRVTSGDPRADRRR